MKVVKRNLYVCFILLSYVFCVGEAGAIFLLINPGAAAAGTGEAQVGKADDAYASYYNPAGLAFLKNDSYALQHVNWLPNLADDIFYDFIAFTKSIKDVGTFGGHLIYLNLGEQTRTDEAGDPKGQFKSYMMALTGSYGMKLDSKSSIGFGFKVFHQKLADNAAVGEVGDPYSTDFAFDFGYMKKFGKQHQHSFGLTIQNIGPPIDFVDAQQADPAPTNMKLGVYTRIYKDPRNSVYFLFDANKLLVASYPAMDWNGDGIIKGSDEVAHKDEWYKAIITSWLDDWYYGGDYDLCDYPCNASDSKTTINIAANYEGEKDNRIGGYIPFAFNVNPDEDETYEEIFIPNYMDFCALDNANCWYDNGNGGFDKVEKGPNVDYSDMIDDDLIKWIDLPHDNDVWEDQYLQYTLDNPIFVTDENGAIIQGTIWELLLDDGDPVEDNEGNLVYIDTGVPTNLCNSDVIDGYVQTYNPEGDVGTQCPSLVAVGNNILDDPNDESPDPDDGWVFVNKIVDVTPSEFGGNCDLDGDGVVQSNPNLPGYEYYIPNHVGEYNGTIASENACNFDIPYTGEHKFKDSEYGVYNVFGNKEKGSGDDREFTDELKEMILNFGFEWWYTQNFALRFGFINDEEGKINNPTFGAGVRFNKYGFDFGYTAGDKGHPRANTLFFSLSLDV